MAKHPSRFSFLGQSAFFQRLTVGVGLMVALSLWLYLLEDVGLLLVALLLAIPLAREWVTICRITVKNRATVVLAFTIMASTLLAYWQVTYLASGLLFLITSVVIFLGWLTWRRGFLWLGGGILYLGLPFVSLMWMVSSLVEPWSVLLWVTLVLIANDTGGYLVGKSVGGPRLASSISPLKTWSGFAGGLVGSIGAGAIAHVIFPLGMTAWENAGLSLLLALGGTPVISWNRI